MQQYPGPRFLAEKFLRVASFSNDWMLVQEGLVCRAPFAMKEPVLSPWRQNITGREVAAVFFLGIVVEKIWEYAGSLLYVSIFRLRWRKSSVP
jgi:hypothetical protein